VSGAGEENTSTTKRAVSIPHAVDVTHTSDGMNQANDQEGQERRSGLVHDNVPKQEKNDSAGAAVQHVLEQHVHNVLCAHRPTNAQAGEGGEDALERKERFVRAVS